MCRSPVAELEFPVFHHVINEGWDWDKLRLCLPDRICSRIVVIKPPSFNAQVDFPCWDFTSDGQFSLKIAYGALYAVPPEEDPPEPLFKMLWNWQGPTRYKGFFF